MDLIKLFSASLAARRDYIQKNNIEAYRLYNLENAALPLAVDIYGAYAVIHIFEKVEAPILNEVEKALKELLRIEEVFYKNRIKSEREEKSANYGEKNVVINEYGHKFFINLSDYLDVGLFLDHRETRKWIASQCRGKVLLNTFAYTGSFSVYAAAAGASKTYSVDLSKTYCDWMKRNFELNKLPLEKNWIYKMDTFEFFKYAWRKGFKFDIIIIDPPTFSRGKKGFFSVQKDHPKLINEAQALLNRGGFILFSNNFKEFEMDKCALSKCVIVEKNFIPPDFTGEKPHRCWIIKSL